MKIRLGEGKKGKMLEAERSLRQIAEQAKKNLLGIWNRVVQVKKVN